jgi:hypothetical protein
MVSKEELEELFEYKDGELIGKSVPWRRKESNSRVNGKQLGTLMPQGHKQLNFRTKNGVRVRTLIHRIIWAMHYNEWPHLIDHIDRNPQNNRIENLRSADKRINYINSGLASNNTSGVKGVYIDKYGAYCVFIKPYKNSKRLNLGRFKTLEKARQIRQDAEKRFWNDL